jgi:hypothetical protein
MEESLNFLDFSKLMALRCRIQSSFRELVGYQEFGTMRRLTSSKLPEDDPQLLPATNLIAHPIAFHRLRPGPQRRF